MNNNTFFTKTPLIEGKKNIIEEVSPSGESLISWVGFYSAKSNTVRIYPFVNPRRLNVKPQTISANLVRLRK